MKNIIRIVFPLLVIAAASGFVLSFTFQTLEPKLALAAKAEEGEALKKVMPGADSFEKIQSEDKTFYKAMDTNSSTIGHIFKEANEGYGGPVEALVGITNGAVNKVVIISMAKETPGLGTKAGDEKWLAQFAGLKADGVPRQKADFIKTNGMDAVSGATLTSMAIANDINRAFDFYTNATNIAAKYTNTNGVNPGTNTSTK
jgi:Na+-translocating ferredoxin:NAD+ oxidoreductase subunit G